MSKWTPALREKAYLLCRERDGEQCHGWGKITCGGRIVANPVTNPLREVSALTVDHIDDNSSNNPMDGSNWQLLCQSCNNKKRRMPKVRHTKSDKFARYKSYRSLHEYVRVGEVTGTISREMEKNDRAEKEFRSFTEEVLRSFPEVKESHLLDAGAQNHFKKFNDNISQATLLRYLSKWTNPINGDFERKKLDEVWHIRLFNKQNTGGKDA